MSTDDKSTGIRRRGFLASAAVGGVALLAGCTGGNGGGTTTGTETTTGGGGDTATLAWHAGGTGGTYYPLSNEFKKIVEEYTDFKLQVQSTGASVENAGSIGSGAADFALLQNDVAYFALKGEYIEGLKGNPIENIRGVATLYPETIHVVTPADAGVSTLTDLQGKTINTGDLGSGTQVDAKQILEAVGVSDYTEQNSDFAQAAEQVQNGDVDAAFVVGGWPVGAIADLATTADVKILPITGEDRTKIENAGSYYADDKIPAGTYNGQTEDVPTVAVQAMIATNAEQPEETVKNVTAAIFDHTDELTIKKDFISKESAQDGMSIDLHPGAKAYFGV